MAEPRSIATLLILAAWAGGAAASPLADALLQNENFKVRLKAATELGKSAQPDGVDALRRALADENALVRAAAINSLGQLKAVGVTSSICALRADPDAFVRRTATRTVEVFGGEAACSEKKVFVEFEVTGGDERLRIFVQTQMMSRAANHPRVLLGRTLDATGSGGATEDPKTAVAEGRMPGVALKLALITSVNRSPGLTQIHCEVAQAYFEIKRERILRGSGTHRADIDLGSSSVTEAAVAGQMQECISALVPVVYEGFGDYLKGVK